MATPFDRLMTTIRPHLPGAIDEAIRQELFMVCMEFFTKSNAWREGIEFELAGGERTSDIMPFAGRITQLMAVVEGTLADQNKRPIIGAHMDPVGTVVMPYPANQTGTYTAHVALTVTDPVTRDAYPIVPQEIVIRYTDDLVSGILSKMMAQPSKPYTNIAMAQLYLSKFRGGTSRARNETNNGNTYGSQRWAYPQSFRTR